MSGKTKGRREPRERILDASKKLFARQCYAATGMRELAEEADVNLAMINYYFGSKHKILEALIDKYLKGFIEISQSCFSGDATPQEKIRLFIRKSVEYLRVNRELAAISLTEFPLEMPELDDFKAGYIKKIFGIISADLMPTLANSIERPIQLEIIMPAIAGMMIFHFVSNVWTERLIGSTPDDKFYEDYIEELTDLTFYGLFGKK